MYKVNCDALGLLNLPTELLNRILVCCTITDLCRLSQVCQKLSEVIQSDYLWSKKWPELVGKSGLLFSSDSQPPSKSSSHTESYRSRCKRLWIVCSGFTKDHSNLPECIQCRNKTCTRQCSENLERKIAIDVGSKTTWLISSNFALQRHPSVLITPPLKCHNESSQNCSHILQFPGGSQVCLLCTHSNYSNVNEAENSGCSTSIASGLQIAPLLPSEKRSPSTKDYCSFFHASFSFTHTCPLWSDLRHSYKTRFPMSEIINPIDSLTANGEFHLLEHYLCHIFNQFKIRKELRKPNVTLMFCMPFNASSSAQKNLMKFMFEVIQVSSVCFVNKAFCIASLIGLETCLVVDSGASNTVVSLVVNNEVQFQRIRHCPVGGVAIANYLAEAIKINGLMKNVSVSSLDTSRVKLSCFLSYNILVEEKRKAVNKQNIFVRSTSPHPSGNSALQKLELGSELYLAPEIMYTAMSLPNMIRDVLNGLDENLIKEALSHLLLTGSNTELNGFATRLIRDIQVLMPQYAHIINVRDYAGSRSWDAVIGATRLILPCSSFSNLKSSGKMPSSLLLVTREDYILHGLNMFE